MNDVSSYDLHVRLATMMITFLREHGYDYDADLNQDLLEEDGPSIPVSNGVDAIIEYDLEPSKDMILLFGEVHDRNLSCDEEYEMFRAYLRERRGQASR